MEAATSSEMTVQFHRTTQSNVPENSNLQEQNSTLRRRVKMSVSIFQTAAI